MKKITIIVLSSILLFQSCTKSNVKKNSKPVRKLNQPFQIFSDRVVEGDKKAVVISPFKLTSNFSGLLRRWTFKKIVGGLSTSDLPQLKIAHFPLVEALYNMALEESLLDIRKDGAFMAGAKWGGVWTRDISYSIHLALAMILPKVSQKSLLAKVNKYSEVIQDTGTGGSWPISTDRVVWAIAAWEIYLATGSQAWLTKSYRILKNVALRDRHLAHDKKTGLYLGESSFLDWRSQTYPSWMNGIDIFSSKALGTNALHYRLLDILSRMAGLLSKSRDGKLWRGWAGSLKSAINNQLWNKKAGYYAAFQYPNLMGFNSDKSESLGEALTVLFKIASPQRAKTVVAKTPLVHFGVPCLYPQQPSPQPYHNKGIWPFVQAYFGWAGAEVKNSGAVNHVFKSMIRASALFLTHKENFVYDTGDSRGTAINSDRQLWSVAGYLSMVYRVLFGIRMDEKGMSFKPFVPTFLGGKLSLTGFSYHRAKLDITLEGQGGTILSLKVDGKLKDANYSLPTNIKGKHKIEIKLGGQVQGQITMGKTEDIAADDTYIRYTLSEDGLLKMRWRRYRDAVHFLLYRNGKLYKKVDGFQYQEKIALNQVWRYSVQAVNKRGIPSNHTETALVIPAGLADDYQAENGKLKGVTIEKKYSGYSGKGYVRIVNKASSGIEFSVNIKKAGNYLLRFRFGNGNGPFNTDNKCAIRSLTIDGKDVGTVVLPQRAFWSNWGYSNYIFKKMTVGSHKVELFYDKNDRNMNDTVNEAVIDKLEVIKY